MQHAVAGQGQFQAPANRQKAFLSRPVCLTVTDFITKNIHTFNRENLTKKKELIKFFLILCERAHKSEIF